MSRLTNPASAKLVPILPMKLRLAGILFSLILPFLSAGPSPAETAETVLPNPADYLVIGWNNLGMHCINRSYAEMAVLPPFNTLMAQVIRRGDPPKVLTAGVTLNYKLLRNTTVEGKSDFWTYAPQLFGVSLPIGTGLAGKGLSGTMDLVGDHFEAQGIPALPLTDEQVWNPFQVAVITLKVHGEIIRSIRVTLPVSDELNCAKCHADGADASAHYAIATGTIEGNILAIHDRISATTLSSSKPVLCAKCHRENNLLPFFLGGAVRSLSESMHGKHATLLDIGYMDLPGCYDCHPGQETQCLRTGIKGMGYPTGQDPNCPTCHGELAVVASSIAGGRDPWNSEPTCEQCHGVNYTTGGSLFRDARGPCGLSCAACHNSPHAWWPSKRWVDDLQPLSLQGKGVSLNDCTLCHTRKKAGDSPHVHYLMKLPVKPH